MGMFIPRAVQQYYLPCLMPRKHDWFYWYGDSVDIHAFRNLMIFPYDAFGKFCAVLFTDLLIELSAHDCTTKHRRGPCHIPSLREDCCIRMEKYAKELPRLSTYSDSTTGEELARARTHLMLQRLNEWVDDYAL